MNGFVSKRPSRVAIETATVAKQAAAKQGGDEKKLTVDLPVSTHSAMKRSCLRRGVTIAKDVVELLEAVYRGGPGVAPVANGDFAAALVAKVASPQKEKEPTIRISLVVPAELYATVIDRAAENHRTMAAEVRELLYAQYIRPM